MCIVISTPFQTPHHSTFETHGSALVGLPPTNTAPVAMTVTDTTTTTITTRTVMEQTSSAHPTAVSRPHSRPPPSSRFQDPGSTATSFLKATPSPAPITVMGSITKERSTHPSSNEPSPTPADRLYVVQQEVSTAIRRHIPATISSHMHSKQHKRSKSTSMMTESDRSSLHAETMQERFTPGFFVRNITGVDMVCRIHSDTEEPSPSTAPSPIENSVPDGSFALFEIAPSDSLLLTLSVLQQDGQVVKVYGQIPVERPGLYVLSAPPSPFSSTLPVFGPSGGTEIVVEVGRRDSYGRHMILITSSVFLRNHTSKDLEVSVEPMETSMEGEVAKVFVRVLHSRHSSSKKNFSYLRGLPLPIQLAKGKIRVRPAGLGFPWSRHAVPLVDLIDKKKVTGFQSEDTEGGEFSVYSKCTLAVFLSNMRGKVPQAPSEIRFRAPLVITNQMPFPLRFRISEGEHIKGEGTVEVQQSIYHMLNYWAIPRLQLSILLKDPRNPLADWSPFLRKFAVPPKKKERLRFVQAPVSPAETPQSLQVFVKGSRKSGGVFAGPKVKLPAHHAEKVILFSPYVIVNQSGVDFLVSSPDRSTKSTPLPNGSSIPYPYCDLTTHTKKQKPYEVSMALKLKHDETAQGATLGLEDLSPTHYSITPTSAKGEKNTAVRTYEFAVSESKFIGLTRWVNISSRYVLVNRSGPPTLICRQAQLALGKSGSFSATSRFVESYVELSLGTHVSFQWPYSNLPRVLQMQWCSGGIRKTGSDRWTPGILLDRVQVNHVNLRSTHGHIAMILRAQVEQQGQCFITFFDRELVSPYRIENHTARGFKVGQRKSEEQKSMSTQSEKMYVPAGGEVPFALEDPLGRKEIILDIPNPNTGAETTLKFSLEKFRSDTFVFDEGQSRHEIVITMATTGTTNLITVESRHKVANTGKMTPSPGGDKLKTLDTDKVLALEGPGAATFALKYGQLWLRKTRERLKKRRRQAALSQGTQVVVVDTLVSVSLAGIQLSINDDSAREVLMLSLQCLNAAIAHKLTSKEFEASVRVQVLQIDEMRHRRPGFKVLLGPIHPPFAHSTSRSKHPRAYFGPPVHSTHEERPPPAIDFALVQKLQFADYHHLEIVRVSIKPLDLRVHGETLLSLENFAASVYVRLKPFLARLQPEPTAAQAILPDFGKEVAPRVRMYVEEVQIDPFRLVLTIKAGISTGTDFSKSPFVSKIIDSFGAAVVDLEDVQISFHGYTMTKKFEFPDNLVKEIGTYYIQQSVWAVGQIVGRLSILGNPISFLDNLKEGGKALIVDTAESLIAPADVDAGLSRGTASLAGGFVRAMSSLSSKFSGSLGAITGRLVSASGKYSSSIRKLQGKVPVSGTSGLRQGARLLGLRAVAGSVGFFRLPLEEANQRGTLGLAAGLIKGTSGLVLQPLQGIIDLLSKSTEGLNNGMSKDWALWNDGRVRLPRTAGNYMNIEKLDLSKATGQEMLRSTHGVHLAEDDRLLDQCLISGYEAVYFTSRLILYRNNAEPFKSWQARYEDLFMSEEVETWENVRLVEGVRVTLETKPPALVFVSATVEVSKDLHHRIQRVIQGKNWIAHYPDKALGIQDWEWL
mmetsp:Transcript_8571/g.14012  ORF Transcript_8571/g.14012 Transcript_8571/m.14012 type:complete len:1590 (+) Transcript_8571:371-5140(+)